MRCLVKLCPPSAELLLVHNFRDPIAHKHLLRLFQQVRLRPAKNTYVPARFCHALLPMLNPLVQWCLKRWQLPFMPGLTTRAAQHFVWSEVPRGELGARWASVDFEYLHMYRLRVLPPPSPSSSHHTR